MTNAPASGDFAGLRALFINGTVNRSPEPSHTQGLVDKSAAIMREHGVEVDQIRAVERLYGYSGVLNEVGQYAYYGRVAGCLLTGNEDGIKHCAMNLLYSLAHIAYTIPTQADAGWIGEVVPGPSYLDPDSDGPENDFTNRNTSFMTNNLLHLAAMLRRAGGIPAVGNRRSEWEAGCHAGHANPEHR